MKISIAMTTWMGERYLKAQLQSFLDQTRLPDELVVRDDGSTDRTLEILRQFAKESPFPTRILPTGSRLGYARNFEAALMHTAGELVFLSDQDDVWFPERIEIISQIAACQPSKMIFINDVENVDKNLQESGTTKLQNLRRSGLPDYRYLTGCATAIRRDLLDFTLPFPDKLKAHDQWLHECGHWLNSKCIVPKVLQYYRRHDSNTSDSLISRPERSARLTSHFETLRSDALQSHRQLLLMTREMHMRMIRDPDQTRRLAGSDPDPILKVLHNRIAALEGRVEILETTWPARLPRALSFWARGGYRSFLGWKSLVNDLLNHNRDAVS